MKLLLIIMVVIIVPISTLAQDSVHVQGTGEFDMCEPVVKRVLNDTTLYYAVQQATKFPGGSEAMYTFVKKEMNASECLTDSEAVQKSYVKFVVERDGRITDASI